MQWRGRDFFFLHFFFTLACCVDLVLLGFEPVLENSGTLIRGKNKCARIFLAVQSAPDCDYLPLCKSPLSLVRFQHLRLRMKTVPAAISYKSLLIKTQVNKYWNKVHVIMAYKLYLGHKWRVSLKSWHVVLLCVSQNFYFLTFWSLFASVFELIAWF